MKGQKKLKMNPQLIVATTIDPDIKKSFFSNNDSE